MLYCHKVTVKIATRKWSHYYRQSEDAINSRHKLLCSCQYMTIHYLTMVHENTDIHSLYGVCLYDHHGSEV